jgi:hypothetical protein
MDIRKSSFSLLESLIKAASALFLPKYIIFDQENEYSESIFICTLKLTNQIDRQDKRPLYLGIFLLIWLAVNLIQAAFTELAHDEAYYWMYSRKHGLGLLRHPPMIALLIKIGTAVLTGRIRSALTDFFYGDPQQYLLYTA